MQKPFFSIIVVSLDPGERLKKTLDSIFVQTCTDYEVIVKDGGSKDGSLESLQKNGYEKEHPQCSMIRKPDKSIYDGMNQAVSYVTGSYVLFLNCGDYLYSNTVLEEVKALIEKDREADRKKASLRNAETGEKNIRRKIYYGNQYNRQQKSLVYSAPTINDFTCYRNVPCHQVCFYDSRLFEKRAYDLKYKVRADYEHFLYSIYKEEAEGVALPLVVASYEGGGFSETKANRKQSAREHKEITKIYLGKAKSIKYRVILGLTLAPLRTWMAESPVFAGVYQEVKKAIYRFTRGA